MKHIIFILLALSLFTALNVRAAVNIFVIKQIHINDFEAFPELDITRSTVEHFLSKQVSAHQGQFNLDELHQVADNLSVYLQEHGLTFTYAYLPPQTIKHQSVYFKLVVGQLDGISVFKNAAPEAKNENYTSAFSDLIAQAIQQNTIEEQLLLLNDYPSKHVFAYYSKGQKKGSTRLNLKLSEKPLINISFRTDNHGSVQTGEYRGFAQLQLHDPLGLEDKLTLAYLYTIEPENSQYGYFNYQVPIGNARHWLSLTASNSRFDIGGGFEALETNGDAQIFQLDWLYKAKRSYLSNHFFTLSLARKENKLSSTQSGLFIDRTETSQNLSIDWQNQLSSTQWYLQQDLKISALAGQVEYISTGVNEPFWKLNLHYRLNKQISPNSWAASQFTLMAYGQYSDAYLPTIEKIPLTGPYAIKAFKPGLISGDRGAYATVEYQIGIDDKAKSWFYVFPYVFAEVAQGQQLSFDAQIINTFNLASLGVGLKLKLGPWLTLSGSWAQSQRGDFGLYGEQEDEQIYADILLKF